jgi:hypothetical protein
LVGNFATWLATLLATGLATFIMVQKKRKKKTKRKEKKYLLLVVLGRVEASDGQVPAVKQASCVKSAVLVEVSGRVGPFGHRIPHKGHLCP